MANLKGMLAVGGLLAVLGSGCEIDYTKDVIEMALMNGWTDVKVECVKTNAPVCKGMNLYNVTGIKPDKISGSAYACCGKYGGGFFENRQSDCKFLEVNNDGGN